MRPLLAVFCGLIAPMLAPSVHANHPILQPGAPGEGSRDLSAEQAIAIANTSYTKSDVRFMQNMVPHHRQALAMAALAPVRTNSPNILEIAGRIDASQDDEIAFMTQWLEQRGEDSEPAAGQHEHHAMRGMATAEQMQALTDASGVAFDRQFLTLMIAHHEGAIEMVDELADQPGSAYDPVLFDFTNDIIKDQSKELSQCTHSCLTCRRTPEHG